MLINRKKQIERIKEILDKVGTVPMSTDSIAPQQLGGGYVWLEMYGLGGIGKSCILAEVKAQCRNYNGQRLPFVGVDFLAADVESSSANRTDFLTRVCDQLDQHYPGASAARGLLRSSVKASRGTQGKQDAVSEPPLSTAIECITGAMQGQPLILLLDSIENCSDHFLNWLGKEFLMPFVEHLPAVAVFLAGRGPRVEASDWPMQLRQNPRTQSVQLDPLDFEATEEHLSALSPSGAHRANAKEIYALSHGHPYSTQAIAYWLKTLSVQPTRIASKREALARRLHKEVIHQYILADADDWVLPFVEVACVTRRFEPATLRQLSQTYRPNLAPNEPVQWYIHRINELLRARSLHLINLDSGGPTYRLDPTFRKLLHTALTILNPAEMLAMHRTMRAFLEDELTAGRVSPASSLPEIVYHTAQAILIEGGDAAQATRAAQEALAVQLSAHFKGDDPRDFEQIILLQNVLDADHELKELLQSAGIEALLAQLKAFRRPQRADQDFAFTHLVIEHEPPNTYRLSWYKDNDVVLPTERLSSGRQFKLADWRSRPEEIGRAAFRLFLPPRAQEFMRGQRDWAIQISTNWTDVPWELLHDGNEFLCLSRPIARRPQMLKEPQRHSREPAAPLCALVIGDPQDNLPGAAAEARAVGKLLAEQGVIVDLLIGSREVSANEFSIRLAGKRRYDLIHYAGHGYFDEHAPQHSGLLFADGALLAEEWERGLNSRAFVFLNACQAARSQATESRVGFQGRFIEGLATSVLLGGASGCLAPMWDIEDTVAQEFALAFYREILGTQPLGEAVRQARVEVRDKSPDHWAAWILYGHPLDVLSADGMQPRSNGRS